MALGLAEPGGVTVKRLIAGGVVAVAALVTVPGIASAAQGPDSKKAFPVECQTGTLAGETLTVVTQKTAFRENATELRVTAFHFEFDGKVKDQQFGKTQGTLTCGGSETSPEGTFTFLATLIEA
jgi:hypothetical protein